MKLRIEVTIPDETYGMPLQEIQVRDALARLGLFTSDHIGMISRPPDVGEGLGGWFHCFPGLRIDYTMTRIPE